MNDFLNKVVVVVAAIVWLWMMWRTYQQWKVTKNWLEPKDLKLWQDEGQDVLVIDVRTPEEFRQEGHIAGAINLPLKELGSRLASAKGELAKFADTPVIVACKVGGRSSTAVPHLIRAGLKKARIMRGGMRRWIEQGLPVQKE